MQHSRLSRLFDACGFGSFLAPLAATTTVTTQRRAETTGASYAFQRSSTWLPHASATSYRLILAGLVACKGGKSGASATTRSSSVHGRRGELSR